MKFARGISLRLRITLLAGAILIFCSIILTITASYNAHSQFTYLTAAGPISVHLSIAEIDTPLPLITVPQAELSAKAITEAKQKFDKTSIIIMFIVTILGMGLVYLFAGRSLRPIHDLSHTISAITEDDLRDRVPILNANDEVGKLGHSFNIMLDRLEKSFTQQKRFSANVAHELKTPLAIINAGIQVLHIEEHPSLSDYAETLETTDRNVNRLISVVDDLMTLYDEQERLDIASINLREMFENIRSELHPILEEKQIETELNCGLLSVLGNQVLLYRAFFNLVENAAKYNKHGGKIRIKTEVENNTGKITISDSGNGIPSDELQQIFEPFYRIDKSRSRKTGGVGLGLSIVKTIIEKHGWRISVDSVFEQGSTFTITISNFNKSAY